MGHGGEARSQCLTSGFGRGGEASARAAGALSTAGDGAPEGPYCGLMSGGGGSTSVPVLFGLSWSVLVNSSSFRSHLL